MDVITGGPGCLSGIETTMEATAMIPQLTQTDLQTHLESLFHAVWEQEKQWRTEDRIDAAVRLSVPAASPQARARTPR